METTIDDLSVHLSTLTTTTSNELTMLNDRRPLSTFVLPSMASCPMASDGHQHLLIYHHQKLIFLRLPTLEILFSLSVFPLIESPISDICFSSFSNCFLLSSSNLIYTFSSNNQLEILHKFSNPIWSITQRLNQILICYLFGFSIEQWEFNASQGILLNTWPKDHLIEPFDMGINCIRAIDHCLGMTIKENGFSWRIDIFQISSMNRIRRGQTIQQENNLNNWIGILFPIDCCQWLFADGDQGLIRIDQTDPHQDQQHSMLKLACNISLIRDINSQRYSAIIIQTYEALNLYDLSQS